MKYGLNKINIRLFTLWSLSIRGKRTDGLPDLLKEVIIDWWTSKTRVSPNKSDATHKRLEAMVYDET